MNIFVVFMDTYFDYNLIKMSKNDALHLTLYEK